MADKITSVAGLRKAVEELRYHADSDRNFSAILKLISEFEAGVRERAEHCEEAAKLTILKEVKVSGSEFQRGLAKQLREILGEGER